MPADAIIVGGSFAGLSAALNIARARRRVVVIDDGQPRNRFASHSHGVLAQDGRSGRDILATAREQLLDYPSVSWIDDRATQVERDAVFRVRTADGATHVSRRLLLAGGMSDSVPDDVPGVKERWGKTVLHCPYCHGYEVGQGRIGVLAAGPMSIHQALLVADWGDVTFFLNGKVALDAEARTRLVRRGIAIVETPVSTVIGASPALDGMRLVDAREIPLDALFIGAMLRQSCPLADQLGCTMDETPMGPIIRTDAWKATSIPGVYAAGDCARAPSNISMAMGDGSLAGVGLHQSLVAEECA